jgi:hypothetical protein
MATPLALPTVAPLSLVSSNVSVAELPEPPPQAAKLKANKWDIILDGLA